MNYYLISFILLLLTFLLSNKHIDIKKDSDWYKCIRPKITPPEWIFGLIWCFIYILLFFAFSNILKSGNSFIILLFVINLVLQILWTYTFFNVKRLDAAFLIIQLLILTTSIICDTGNYNANTFITELKLQFTTAGILFSNIKINRY